MSKMSSREKLQRQYITLLATVTQKQAALKQLDKEYEQIATRQRAAETAKDERTRQQERDDAEVKRLRMRSWQHECSSIILQKENMAIKNQFDKREFLVKLGIMEIRLRKLADKWIKVKLDHSSSPTTTQATGDNDNPALQAADTAYHGVYQQLKLLFDELQSMYSNVYMFVEKANKSFQRRPDEGEETTDTED